jgi:type II secretory pathway pseudopilin PulG
MVGRQYERRRRRLAVAAQRAATLLEVLTVAGIIAVVALFIGIPSYASYARERQARDAASTLAQDLALLERSAQNDEGAGATLEIDSASPFAYSCYHGRPSNLDPRTTLGGLIVQRSFPGVTLGYGPIGKNTPLLFASNGSAQYFDGVHWVDQHGPPIAFTLTPASYQSGAAAVTLDMFTGEISGP